MLRDQPHPVTPCRRVGVKKRVFPTSSRLHLRVPSGRAFFSSDSKLSPLVVDENEDKNLKKSKTRKMKETICDGEVAARSLRADPAPEDQLAKEMTSANGWLIPA